MSPFGLSLGGTSPDDVAHIIQVSLAPAFLLTALATLLNVFSTRLARIADKVNATARDLARADAAETRHLARRLSYLRRRSFLLDIAVVLASLGAVLTLSAILTLFVGALRDAAAATVLFGCFGTALLLTVGAISAFLCEILMAGRGVRVEVDRQQDQAAGAARA
ncbi:DUF2721 domain-containing protein [Methylobacterium sp. NEAU 140]|uniref:DUF2721 domain-containing protein n=1 Tax=Methylobacterium sp. NEAU 140 TaxID=3064945 RepID=UPI0027357555|nr:DUF2721 domain-containing protein [Methylobacterium sp. NEAU 140]MDP4024190.1 DUF2721 domain-containing protein [Methylobacterium sp. NEAU 140]